MKGGLDKLENKAREVDGRDPLRHYRDRFCLPSQAIYLLGNSLGLAPKLAEKAVARVMRDWQDSGIDGWLHGDPPWFYLAERLGAMAAPLVGAAANEVVATATTTVNIHSLIGTFYAPDSKRKKIVATSLDFPSDIYALKGQMALRNIDPAENLVLVPSSDGHTIAEEAVISAMTPEVALVFLPSVLYRSGQLLDMPRLCRAARERGIAIGFDCCHSAGAIPHRFDDWGVDFATWCSYKYLNSGPGGPAFLYVAGRHFRRRPMLAGWFGSAKEKQFGMNFDFEHAESAGGWQISSPAILSSAPVESSLEIIQEAGIERIREKSLALTDFLVELVSDHLSQPPYGIRIATPLEEGRRGGHVALEREEHAWKISQALKKRGVTVDFRPPNIIRLAPVALYNTFREVWQATKHLQEIIDTGEFSAIPPDRSPIT